MSAVLSEHTAPAAAKVQNGLHLQGLSKRFGVTQALSDVGFTAGPGEIIAVCGPSGAGKTTLGRLISGLEQADAGSIALGPRQLLVLPPQQRRIAHMFESYALYPTNSVVENIVSPLRSPLYRNLFSEQEQRNRAAEVMELTEIAALGHRLPSELSGGQKQRVALCRTLVQSPGLFILDEPIGHLDAKLRHKLRGEIRRRQQSLPQPTLWLTPDAVEAMAVADRVVMLVNGKVAQIGSPHDIYLKPANLSIARLVGDPAMNLLDISIDAGGKGAVAAFEGGSFYPASGLLHLIGETGLARCVLGFAPAEASIRVLSGDQFERPNEISGEIYSVEPFGKFTLVTVDIGGPRLRVKTGAEFNAEIGNHAAVQLPQRVLLFDAVSGQLRSWHG